MHHAQLFRLLAQDLEDMLTVERLADQLSQLADIMVAATVKAVWRTITQRHCEEPLFSVVAYGKLGGKELGYASDLDLVFLYDDDNSEAPANYAKLAQRFITWMTSHTPAGILFDIDIALRPDGASGLMVSSIQAFERYQTQSAWPWEHQAITRARCCTGPAELIKKFDALREHILCLKRDPEMLKQEVLKMRQKMRDSHPVQPEQFDLKHSPGGMIDIEFMVQYLILRYAHQYPQLCANYGNIALMNTCGELGLIDAEAAHQVADIYRQWRKLQHMIRLQGVAEAKIDIDKAAAQTEQVSALWHALFTDT
jgi:glutamate-ammonia-ligase adenylyltransferase